MTTTVVLTLEQLTAVVFPRLMRLYLPDAQEWEAGADLVEALKAVEVPVELTLAQAVLLERVIVDTRPDASLEAAGEYRDLLALVRRARESLG